MSLLGRLRRLSRRVVTASTRKCSFKVRYKQFFYTQRISLLHKTSRLRNVRNKFLTTTVLFGAATVKLSPVAISFLFLSFISLFKKKKNEIHSKTKLILREVQLKIHNK